MYNLKTKAIEHDQEISVNESSQQIALTNEQKISNLNSEYQANIALWQHDDNLRQQRFGTFLNINTILLVALGTLITISPSIRNSSMIAILVSLFGFPICIMWHRILIRNGEYIRFRRFQLRFIEQQLQNVTTITNQWNALNKHQTITLPDFEDTFTVTLAGKRSSTSIETKLPLILASFWLLVLVIGLVFFMF